MGGDTMMKFLFVLLIPSAIFAEGPIFRHKDTFVNQEFDNAYQDIRSKPSTGFVVNASSFNANGVSSATANASIFVYTNIAVTVTVRKSNNKVFLLATGYAGNDTANDGCDFGFYRDSTFIHGTNGGVRLRNPSASVVQQVPFSIAWMDAPGTGTFTYRLGFRAVAGGTCTVNGIASTDAPMFAFQIDQ